jgi:hypothetical protein
VHATAVLAQVERVEVDARAEEELGQVGLEEVVDEAVHIQHGGVGGPVGPARDERGRHHALVVVAERDGAARVRLAEDVGNHINTHAATVRHGTAAVHIRGRT